MTGVKIRPRPIHRELHLGSVVCRLYLGLSKLDRETARACGKRFRLRVSRPIRTCWISSADVRVAWGKAVTPRSALGGAWAELVGASPDQGAAFFEKLIARMTLAGQPVRRLARSAARSDYLTTRAHEAFYAAVRGRVTSPDLRGRVPLEHRNDAAHTRLQLDAGGKVHIPQHGGLEEPLRESPTGQVRRQTYALRHRLEGPDDVLEALFALCRKSVENEPLKIFMAITDVDRNRAALWQRPR